MLTCSSFLLNLEEAEDGEEDEEEEEEGAGDDQEEEELGITIPSVCIISLTVLY